jgi:hypothetical protein
MYTHWAAGNDSPGFTRRRKNNAFLDDVVRSMEKVSLPTSARMVAWYRGAMDRQMSGIDVVPATYARPPQPKQSYILPIRIR